MSHYNGIIDSAGRSLRELLAHATGVVREKFIEKLPLFKSAALVKKSKWASGVCAYLEQRFSEDEIRKIRMDCSCNPGGKAEKVKSYLEIQQI